MGNMYKIPVKIIHPCDLKHLTKWKGKFHNVKIDYLEYLLSNDLNYVTYIKGSKVRGNLNLVLNLKSDQKVP